MKNGLFKTWFLSLPKETKIEMLEDALKDDDTLASFLSLSKILLDTPLSEGGISSEEIDSVFNKYEKTEN